MTPLLELTQISKHFGGVAALEGVDLHINQGECLALVGGNGAGKSTLVSLVAGIARPDSGRMRFGGRDVQYSSSHEAQLAGIETVFQHLALCGNLDAAGNLFLGREIGTGVPGLRILRRRQMEAATARTLAELGVRIPDLRSASVNFSGGQRQALAFARAVRGNARLLLLDEPTAALGVEERTNVVRTLTQLREERGLSMLLITHNLTEMRQLADRVAVLRRGRMVGSLPMDGSDDDEIVSLITGSNAT